VPVLDFLVVLEHFLALFGPQVARLYPQQPWRVRESQWRMVGERCACNPPRERAPWINSRPTRTLTGPQSLALSAALARHARALGRGSEPDRRARGVGAALRPSRHARPRPALRRLRRRGAVEPCRGAPRAPPRRAPSGCRRGRRRGQRGAGFAAARHAPRRAARHARAAPAGAYSGQRRGGRGRRGARATSPGCARTPLVAPCERGARRARRRPPGTLPRTQPCPRPRLVHHAAVPAPAPAPAAAPCERADARCTGGQTEGMSTAAHRRALSTLAAIAADPVPRALLRDRSLHQLVLCAAYGACRRAQAPRPAPGPARVPPRGGPGVGFRV